MEVIDTALGHICESDEYMKMLNLMMRLCHHREVIRQAKQQLQASELAHANGRRGAMARDREGRRAGRKELDESDGAYVSSKKGRVRREDEDSDSENGRDRRPSKDEKRKQKEEDSDDKSRRDTRKSESGRRRKRSKEAKRRSDEDSEKNSEDESEESAEERKSRKKSSKRRRRRDESSDDSEADRRRRRRDKKKRVEESEESEESSEEEGGRKKITKEEIEAYLRKKAEKKVSGLPPSWRLCVQYYDNTVPQKMFSSFNYLSREVGYGKTSTMSLSNAFVHSTYFSCILRPDCPVLNVELISDFHAGGKASKENETTYCSWLHG
jgi:hypothetical protein